MLPQLMDTSSAQSPYFLAYKAAQVKLGDKGFLSRDITVHDLLLNRSDVHHVYPKNHLKKPGPRARPLQPDRQLRARPERDQHRHRRQGRPRSTSASWLSSATGGKKKYGGITSLTELQANLRTHCLPESLLDGEIPTTTTSSRSAASSWRSRSSDWFEVL